MKKILLILFCTLSALHLTADSSALPFSFPPLFFSLPDDPVEKRSLTYALGPFFEYTSSDDNSFTAAFHPLWSRTKRKDYFAEDIIWPLFARRTLKDEWNMRLLLYYTSGFNKPSDKDRDRIALIPFWFSGHDYSNNFYWALFPVYGTAKFLMGYDSIYWVLFPIYLKTVKGKSHGAAWLWPFYNWDTGPRFDKMRIFPFYAYNHRFGQFENYSVIWPFWHVTESLNPKVPGGGWLLWPLIGHTAYKNPERSSWSFIWPLFQSEHTSYKNGTEGVAFNAPWPVIQFKKNIRDSFMHEGTDWQLYIFPLWGHRIKQRSDYGFILWPLGSWLTVTEEGSRTEWLWALPLYFSKNAWNRKGEKEETYRHFWPFASYYRDPKKCVIRALDINPFRNFPAVQRNWDPLWRLFRYVKTETGTHYDILWGLCSSTDAEYMLPGSKRTAKEQCFGIYPFYEQLHMETYAAKQVDQKEAVQSEEKETADITRIFFGAYQSTVRNGKHSNNRLFWVINW